MLMNCYVKKKPGLAPFQDATYTNTRQGLAFGGECLGRNDEVGEEIGILLRGFLRLLIFSFFSFFFFFFFFFFASFSQRSNKRMTLMTLITCVCINFGIVSLCFLFFFSFTYHYTISPEVPQHSTKGLLCNGSSARIPALRTCTPVHECICTYAICMYCIQSIYLPIRDGTAEFQEFQSNQLWVSGLLHRPRGFNSLCSIIQCSN